MADSGDDKVSPSPGGPRLGYRERQRRYVRRCEDRDHAAVTAFRQAMYGKDATVAAPAVTEWYARLPGGGGSPLWVFEKDGAIVGHQVVVPTRVWVGGRPVDGAFGTHLVVEPAWRARGIGSILTEVTLGGVPLAYGLDVTDDAAAALGRMGWLDLGTLPLYVAILRPGPFLRMHLHASPYRTHAALAAGVFRPSFDAWQAATGVALRLRGIELRPAPRFDGRIETIWQSSAPHYPVICERTAARLNWAFADFPEAGRYHLFHLERRGAPVGYAVLRTEERRGEKVAVLVDFLVPPAELPDLARAACLWAWQEHACALYCVCSGPAAAELRRAGMFLRDSAMRAMSAPARVSPAERALAGDLGNWFFTAGDANLDRPREGIVYAT